MFGAVNGPLGRVRLFVQVILCIVMSGFDAVATIHHVSIGVATELNPAMDYFIHKDFILFFWIKIATTAIGLIICYVLSQHFIARRALWFVTLAYTLLTAYHYLIYRLF